MLKRSFTTQIPNHAMLAQGGYAARFKSEHSLVVEFTKKISLLDYCVHHEFDSTYGIADIVLFRQSGTTENAEKLASIPDRLAYVLRRLPYRKIFKTSDFASLANTTNNQAKRVLSQLSHGDYINQNDSDSWIKKHQPKPISNEIIAIEAKLTKWKGALSQAIRYRHFAHQSWVLLDNKTRGAAIDNLQDFQRFNIGLISLDQCGNLTSHFSPVTSRPKSPQLFWLANVRLANRLL